jgi:hypothetical protein
MTAGQTVQHFAASCLRKLTSAPAGNIDPDSRGGTHFSGSSPVAQVVSATRDEDELWWQRLHVHHHHLLLLTQQSLAGIRGERELI